jgi:hypothetical protein
LIFNYAASHGEACCDWETIEESGFANANAGRGGSSGVECILALQAAKFVGWPSKPTAEVLESRDSEAGTPNWRFGEVLLVRSLLEDGPLDGEKK